MSRRIAGSVALAVLVAATLTLLVRSVEPVVVVGDSMEPAMHEGDLVLARPEPDYEVGDVIAFRVPESDEGSRATVIHRVVGGSAGAGYRTLGDNRETVDLWRPRPRDVLGASWIHIPWIGRALVFLRSPLGLGLPLAVLLFLGIATGAIRPPGLRRRDPDGPEEPETRTRPLRASTPQRRRHRAPSRPRDRPSPASP